MFNQQKQRDTQPSDAERTQRRQIVERPPRRATFVTLVYPATGNHDGDAPSDDDGVVEVEDPFRDMGGDARTTAESGHGRLPECSLHTARNLYRDPGLALQWLADHSMDKAAASTGDIRVTDWASALQPLVRRGEVFLIFRAYRVASHLLRFVRLAARVAHGSTHVTAILRDERQAHAAFRHYDNDSLLRQLGLFALLTPADLHTNAMLFAIVEEDSELHRAVKALPQLDD